VRRKGPLQMGLRLERSIPRRPAATSPLSAGCSRRPRASRVARLVALVSLLLLACSKASPAPPAPAQVAVAVPAGPTVEPVDKRLVIDGWLDMKWGDSVTASQEKLKTLLPKSFHCSASALEPKNGTKRTMISCETWKVQPDGRREVYAYLVDGALGRVIVNYYFQPYQSTLFNLQKALEGRYCPLRRDLNDVVKQSMLGNAGQTSQADFDCSTIGDLYLQIENGENVSRVGVTLSSRRYTAFLNESEHEHSF
jgi:hypothetical protein